MLKGIRFFIFLTMIFFFAHGLNAFDGYGVNSYHLSKLSEGDKEKVFEFIEKTGVGWIRIGFRWFEIEPAKGAYDFAKNDSLVELARKHNLKILGVVTRVPEWASVDNDTTSPPKEVGEWARFINDIARRYKGKIEYWEVWNEPDIKKFWTGTPEEYVELLKTAYKVIKDIDPSMKVLSAGLDGNGEAYIEKLLNLSADKYCDIIAFHPYGRTPEKSLERVKNFLEVMKKYGAKKPLWLTEIGWQTGGWQDGIVIVKDEETKARYLKESFNLLRPHAGAIFWYQAVDPPMMFGLIELDKGGNIKLTPSYEAYKEMMSENK